MKGMVTSYSLRWINIVCGKLTAMLLGIILVISCASCNSSNEEADDSESNDQAVDATIKRDLDEIKADGKLKVLISYSSTSYFLYRGQPMGFEYEMLERLAEELDLELELQVLPNIDSIFYDLNHGEADLIAYGLTITQDRKEKVDFTDYLYLTSQVLVQRKPENWRNASWAYTQSKLIHDAIELIGDTVSVTDNSSYIERIDHLSEELGDEIYVDTLPGHLSTERIIKQVVDGEIKYTVADENLAHVSATYYPILDIQVPISFSQRIAWAVRKNSPKLLSAINNWIEEEKKEVDYYVIYNKYFKDKRDFRRRIESEFNSLNSNQISVYDDLIKRNADEIGWDWRLVASLVFQESRFKPTAKSWAGARGLMQIMPATAGDLGVTDPTDPAQSVRGGTKYLGQLHKMFSSIPDSIEQIKFTMGSYNCGFGHVRDAQVLAAVNGLDSTVWDDNVEKMVLALSYPENYNHEVVDYGYVRGIEPVTYVDQIFKRYDHYVKFINE